MLRVLEDPASIPHKQFALWELGFRPFYLLASALAALSVPLWALQVSGFLGHTYLAGPVWHAHEMLFGFALAVIVGFLFTAGRNWTNQPTPSGSLLMALAALWLVARVLVLTRYGVAAAVANVAFPWAAATALAVPFIKVRNRRNYFFVGLLVLMGAAAGCIHLTQLGLLDLPPWIGLQLALDVVLFIVAVMGGRVIPMFTNNGVAGASASRRPAVEKVALVSVLALAAADVAGLHGAVLAAVAAAAGLAHAVRWALWQPWKTRRVPLVWVLHLAYLWIPVHLGLRAFSEIGVVAPSLAIHALTTGAIGGLIIGMMTRTSRGHTGRPLRADRFDTTCYVLVLTGALVRVLMPLLVPEHFAAAMLLSAACWSGGFALFALRYWPVLSRARVDGRPG